MLFRLLDVEFDSPVRLASLLGAVIGDRKGFSKTNRREPRVLDAFLNQVLLDCRSAPPAQVQIILRLSARIGMA